MLARTISGNGFRLIWEDPRSLDPAHRTAKVTREIAGKLADISKALEERGFDAGDAALFLMRCLFTMFVEDVELIKKGGFTELLSRCAADPKRFPHEMEDLWKRMDKGDYSPAIGERLLRFNGKLFKNANALELEAREIALLQEAARADWKDLEPAIFGTLFENAIAPAERRRFGTHYTPRSYVELLVNATIMEPLVDEWTAAQSAAERALTDGSKAAAIREIADFLKDLSKVRVLDPAAGTGNFLYVALRQMKQLEGEVLKHLTDLGGDDALEAMADVSVTPDQFFGLESNPRALAIAELVLWIGHLQWHLRTRSGPPKEPVLGSSDHVLHRDAVLTWEGYPAPQLKRDNLGRPMHRKLADGQLVEVYDYPTPNRPAWPDADFIVGNPPFIGGKDIRSRLGDEYAEALWKAHKHVNPSADYVMYWWDRAAETLTREGTRLRRFGLVTTNSITQVFQRRVIERAVKATRPVSIVLAIPDHPWTKASADAAAVRIAMTVVIAGQHQGTRKKVVRESELETDQPKLEFVEGYGTINPDLTIGVDATSAVELRANAGLCSPGVKLHGSGFIVTPEEATRLGLGRREGLNQHIRPYRNGRDLTARARNVMVVDLLGLPADLVRSRFPEVYQHLLQRVKPDRDLNRRAGYRDKWWVFGEPRPELRPALSGLPRYIATVETATHRVFQFLDASILPDNMVVAIALDDAFCLGVLSSRIHVIWALRSGGWLGVGNDPRYSKSRCFDPFPFPDCTEALRIRIRQLSEELDATRKLVLAENADLTLTGLYNLLEKIRPGSSLTDKEADQKDRGRVLILAELHHSIDAAVSKAYGWPAEILDDEILERLVALNSERTTEERRGFLRWVRPDYQIEKFGPLAHRADKVQSISVSRRAKAKRIFPEDLKSQGSVVLELIRQSRRPISAEEIAANFSDESKTKALVSDVLRSLNRLGEAQTYDNGRTFIAAA